MFAQQLAKIINNHYGIVNKTGRKLLSYFSDKIKNKVQDTSDGVYKIPCTDCDHAYGYIGETGKSLRIRLKQQESNCRDNSNPCAVVNHHKLGHIIDFENSCVIYPESYMTKQKIAESLLISQQQHVMDGNMNSFRLSVFRQ